MKKTLLSLAIVALLSGCATDASLKAKFGENPFQEPVIEKNTYLEKNQSKLNPPSGGPIPVAVYGFHDRTGQRKSIPNIASLSSAVTQGADSYLIKSLQEVGDARWFVVLERVGLENLIKERQMIRQMREQYQGKDAKPLPPMMFAGVIVEGGIIGYDSNTLTGGNGMRIFGIGASTQYQSDTVTVNLRTVSVSTGEVLTNTTVTKTVLSYMDKLTVLRFVGDGTSLGANATALEGEFGGSINESINKAIDIAIQAAVVNTIKEGARKGHWSFKEDKKDELVQKTTENQGTTEATTVSPKPNERKSDEGSKAEDKPSASNGEQKTEVIVAQADPKDLAKKNNPVLGARADATVVADLTPKAAAIPAPALKKYKTIQPVTVREDATKESKFVMDLPIGKVVEVVETKGDRIKVALDGKLIGWVYKPLLEEVKGN